MNRKSYYLGLDSVEAALDAVDALSFFTVIDKKTAQVQYAHEDRMALGICPIEEPVGAVLFVTGAFTPEEEREIEALARHSYAPLDEAVADVVARTAVDLEKRNVRITHQVLGESKSLPSTAPA